jgi:hypothetical protein
MKKIQQNLKYKNTKTQPVLLVLEPWAEHYWIAPESVVDILGDGGDENTGFEIYQTDDGIILHGWTGSIVTLLCDGIEIKPNDQV